MRKTLVATIAAVPAFWAGVLSSTPLLFAMTLQPMTGRIAVSSVPPIVTVAGGCGVGFHRGPDGECYANNAYGVGPGTAVTGRACPPGFHLGPYGVLCRKDTGPKKPCEGPDCAAAAEAAKEGAKKEEAAVSDTAKLASEIISSLINPSPGSTEPEDEPAKPAVPPPQRTVVAEPPPAAAPPPAAVESRGPTIPTVRLVPQAAAPAPAEPPSAALESTTPTIPKVRLAPAPVAEPAPPPSPAPQVAVTEPNPPPPPSLPARTEAVANTPIGVWLTEKKEGRVHIVPCGVNYCGFVVDAKTGQDGERVLIDMKAVNATKWSGRIHDPKGGGTYDSTIAITGPETLRVQGCAFGGMICRGQTWRRV